MFLYRERFGYFLLYLDTSCDVLIQDTICNYFKQRHLSAAKILYFNKNMFFCKYDKVK